MWLLRIIFIETLSSSTYVRGQANLSQPLRVHGSTKESLDSREVPKITIMLVKRRPVIPYDF